MTDKEVVYVCPEIVDEEPCAFEAQNMAGLRGHQDKIHGLTKEDRPNLKEQAETVKLNPSKVKKKEKEDKKTTKKKTKKGGKKTDEDIVQAEDINKSRLKGKLRRLMSAIGTIQDENMRNFLLPEREVVMDSMKMLQKVSISMEAFLSFSRI